MNRPTIIFCALSIILILFSCSEDVNKKPGSDNLSKTLNTEVNEGFEIIGSAKTGITFQNKLSDDPLSSKNVLSYRHYFNGAGVGVADFNNDGLQDVFFAGNEVPNELYINKGELKFEKLGQESGLNQNKVWASGVSIVDINSDGYQDIYVSQQGPNDSENRKNLFYINNGDLTFTESAKKMGLDDANYSTQAVFLDYDKDGDLDCYVMNESKYAGVILSTVYKELKNEDNLRKASGKLFRNNGNLKFTDVTKASGVLNYGYGLGIGVSDFNGDNWPDIYIANDYTVPDFMYINQKDGTFKESVKDYTRQLSYFGMGCDIADINNDGLVDIGVVDMAAEDHERDKTLMAGMDIDLFHYYFNERKYQLQYMFNSLQLNNGNGTFSNIAALAGVLKSDWSWAALFSDFNLDGYKDYYVCNGFRRYSRDNDFMIAMNKTRQENNGSIPLSKRQELYDMMPEIKLDNKLYINDGKLHFNDNDQSFSHPNYATYSYGVAQGDFDNDGDMDLIVNNIDQPVLFLRNKATEITSNNYLQISLDEKNVAKKLYSKIRLFYGDSQQLQEYSFVRGYESTMQECLNFGLGDVTKIDKITIEWPDGNIQTLTEIEANQHLKIKYQKGKKTNEVTKINQFFTQQSPKSKGLNFKHTENEFDDFVKEILLPQRQTAFGPALASADINNDGLDDIYIGGAKGQSGQLFIQNKNGNFSPGQSQPWKNEATSEDVAAIFLDVNLDGNKDLIVLSGGSGDFESQPHLLVDRFYANTGNGNFARIANVLPVSNTASYEIVAENIDEDPHLELMIIGAAKAGKYPQKENTIILDYVNNSYVDITGELIPGLNDKDGLIRSAQWIDLNGDGKKDLITAGEWQSPELYINENGTYKNRSKEWNLTNHNGWWRSINSGDFDKDGDIDFIIGNVGKNFKQKASSDHPLYLYSNDFDNNGTLDCVLAKPYKGRVVPARGKECSTQQMPFVSEKFESYASFASASIEDIYGEEKLNSGIKLEANTFYSYLLRNNGSSFEFEKLPPMAQISPINDIEIMDINKDGFDDLLIVGNDYNTEYETPRLDAGNGLVLLNDKKGYFKELSVEQSGVFCPKDAKKLAVVNSNGKKLIIVGNNNDYPDVLELN